MTLDRDLGVGRGHPKKEVVAGRADPVRDAAWALGVHPPRVGEGSLERGHGSLFRGHRGWGGGRRILAYLPALGCARSLAEW